MKEFQIEIAPITNNIQVDIQMLQEDMEYEDYDLSVGTQDNQTIIIVGNKNDLENLVSEETFRESYLGGVSIQTAKNLIHAVKQARKS